MKIFNVGVVGAGYVGLVTAACLTHVGHRVTCLDRNQERVEGLREDRIPIYEAGLDGLVTRGVRGGRLSFAGLEGLPELVREADVVFIAVDTPQGEDGSADLSSVATVARTIGRALVEAPPGSARSSLSTRALCRWAQATTSRCWCGRAPRRQATAP